MTAVPRSWFLLGALLFEHGVSRLEELPADAQREYSDALEAERESRPRDISIEIDDVAEASR